MKPIFWLFICPLIIGCADIDPLPVRVEKKLDRTAVQISGEEEAPPDDPEENEFRRDEMQRQESWADDVR